MDLRFKHGLDLSYGENVRFRFVGVSKHSPTRARSTVELLFHDPPLDDDLSYTTFFFVPDKNSKMYSEPPINDDLRYKTLLVVSLNVVQPTTAQRCLSAAEKFILEFLFSSILSQFKKYHPSGNLKFKYSGIFQCLKLRILIEKILSISLKLNFTPNTLGCYGLKEVPLHADTPFQPVLRNRIIVCFPIHGF